MVNYFSFQECKPILLFTTIRQRQPRRTRIKEPCIWTRGKTLKKKMTKIRGIMGTVEL